VEWGCFGGTPTERAAAAITCVCWSTAAVPARRRQLGFFIPETLVPRDSTGLGRFVGTSDPRRSLDIWTR
jgi:hypothetical protein